jgi:hypothetical protein
MRSPRLRIPLALNPRNPQWKSPDRNFEEY